VAGKVSIGREKKKNRGNGIHTQVNSSPSNGRRNTLQAQEFFRRGEGGSVVVKGFFILVCGVWFTKTGRVSKKRKWEPSLQCGPGLSWATTRDKNKGRRREVMVGG